MINKIYIDLDGVLADFEGQYQQLFGKHPRDAGDEETWKRILQYEDAGNCWFLDLPKMKNAEKLWNYITNLSGVTVVILSATGHNYEEHGSHKKTWSKKHFKVKDKDVIVVRKSKLKGEYGNEESILIDDSPRSINAFIENGGIGILHTSVDDTLNKLKVMFGNAGIV